MKNIINQHIKIAVVAMALLLSVGCRDEYKLDLPLAVDMDRVNLTKDGGETHVMVYSNGTWQVSLSEENKWATIDRTSGKGNGDFVFTYQPNAGLSRSATVVLEKDGDREEITMYQAAGETDPTLILNNGMVMLMRDGLTIDMALSTNLVSELDRIKVDVSYADGGGQTGWINTPVLSADKLTFDVDDNTMGEARTAIIRLSISDADGQEYKTATTISQSSEAATLAFKDAQTIYDAAPNGEELIIPLTTNLSGYYNIVAEIEYSGTSQNWLTQYSVDDAGLHLVVPTNKDAERTATLVLSYTAKDGSSTKTSAIQIKQDKEAAEISFEALRQMVSGSTEITDNLFIEGYVISDCDNLLNMELNPNTDHKTVDTSESLKTAYIQSKDGAYGFRLKFNEAAANTLKRYSKVALSVRRTTVSHESNPDRYTIGNLTATNIISSEDGTVASLPLKQKGINELTDADIYTYVSLSNMEFVFKDGAYANVYESYVLKSNFNSNGNNRCDGWATLMTDNRGRSIYMLLNTLCPWRRTGSGVPQGTGTMNGIVVHTPMPRFGNNLGTYQIRPIVESDIAINSAPTSAFTTLVEWNWNDGKSSLNFENAGTTSTATANDRVLADVGTGFMSSASGCTMAYSADYNDLVTTNKGLAASKGIVCSVAANKWWNWTSNSGVGFEFEFGTQGISGSMMQITFEFGAGNIGIAKSYDFPTHWQVEYSTDGVSYTKANHPTIVLRSLPWWDGKVGGVSYVTSFEAGLGHTGHQVNLPASLFGQSKVVVRLVPSDKVVATLAPTNTESGTLTQSTTTSTDIRFGSISIRYK